MSRGASAEEGILSKLALSSDRAFPVLWPCPALGGSSLIFSVWDSMAGGLALFQCSFVQLKN